MLTVRFKLMNLQAGHKVLDLGCGEGRHVHGLHTLPGIEAVGLDLDEASLQKAGEGLSYLDAMQLSADGPVTFIRGSAYKLPFDDNSFDGVICSEVFEHLENYPQVIREIRRVLKPGGTFALTVPHSWPERICWQLAPPPNGYPFDPGGHIRIFDDTHLKFELVNNGFNFKQKHHAHGLHAPFWWLKCAFWAKRDSHPLIIAYHRFLVWDLMKRPFLTRALEWALAPVMGKSVALYFVAGEK